MIKRCLKLTSVLGLTFPAVQAGAARILTVKFCFESPYLFEDQGLFSIPGWSVSDTPYSVASTIKNPSLYLLNQYAIEGRNLFMTFVCKYL